MLSNKIRQRGNDMLEHDLELDKDCSDEESGYDEKYEKQDAPDFWTL